jgi:hypothetical protein
MPIEPIQALQAATRAAPAGPARPTLLIAGATGALGNEVMRRLVGLQRHASTTVLAREPILAGLHHVTVLPVSTDAEPDAWAPASAQVGVIMFDPPRLFHDRERALWTPHPAQLVPLARWMRDSGVTTLALVLPHDQGRLPEALKRGLASLDEQAVAALGFERLLVVRSARKPAPVTAAGVPARIAAWMLQVVRFMVPSSEQPVRAVKVAEFVSEAMARLPRGIHIAAPELVWQASQGRAAEVVGRWLMPSPVHSTAKSGL